MSGVLGSGSLCSFPVRGGRLLSALVATAVALTVAQWDMPVAEAAQVPSASSIVSAVAPKAPLVASDVRSAQLTARVRGQRVEALSERTEDSSTWVNPDGSFTSESFAGAVRMRDTAAESGWVDLDPTLVRSGDGSVAARAHPEFLKLSGPVASTGGTTSLVSVVDPGDPLAAATRTRSRARGLSWGWPGRLPAPVLAGTKATYPEVRPGMDLVVEATTTGFEQYLVVKVRPSDPADVVMTLPVVTRGLRLAADGQGGATIKDTMGAGRGRMPAPVMWDAKQVVGADIPADQEPVAMTVTQASATAATVSLTPDPAYLMDPATVYPVTIDPSSTLSASFDTYVQSNVTSTDYSTSTELRAGTYDGGTTKARSFLTFPLPFKGATVSAATFNIHNSYSYTCAAQAVDVHVASAASSATRWANQPYINAALYSRVTASKGYSSACAAGTLAFNVKTLAQYWADSTSSVQAYAIQAGSETSSLGWKKFNSANATSGRPYLSVTYNRPPNTPGTPTHTPGTSSPTGTTGWTNSLTPTLRATVTDPDGGTVRGLFSVYLNGTGTPIVNKAYGSSVSSGGTSVYMVPAGKLVSGSNFYVVRAYGYDGALTSAAWSSGYDRFTVDTTAPATAPAVSSATFPEDAWSDAVDGANKAHFDITRGTSDSTTVQWYLGGATAWGNTAAVSGTTPAIDAALDLTSVGFGEHYVYARSLDLAGNSSPTRTYRFFYGTGVAVAQPLENQVTARRLPLQLSVDPALVTSLGSPSFEYRRGDADPLWHPVPLGEVSTAAGAAVTAWPAQADSTTVYFWDAATTLGGIGGVIEVRARFSTSAPPTLAVTTTVDIDDGQAASGAAGPGSVNLSTGQLSLSGSDANWFGVGVDRSYGSRSLTAGTSDGQAGAFGPQWASGATGGDSPYTIVRMSSPTSLDVVAAGDLTSFTLKAGTSGTTANWVPQPGAEDLQLVGDPAGADGSVFTLTTTDRTVITFKKPDGGPDGTWPVYSTTSSGGHNAARYGSAVDAAGKLRLSVIAAPNPGLTPSQLDACATIPVPPSGPARGCRVLTLTWGDVATDTGTQPRVTGIDAWGWDPATSAMTKTTLAGFGYDAHGWLISATDTITNLVTGYGYDTSSGLLTSLTPAHAASAPLARLPFTFGYADGGITAAPVWDRSNPTSGGRLVSVTRATLAPGSQSTINGTATTAIVYGVPVTKSGHGPADVAATNTASWGQVDPATDGTAVFDADAASQPGSNTDFWAGDDTTTRSWAAAAVTYVDVNGREVNHYARDGALDATSYDIDGNQVFALSAGNRAIATGEAPGADALGLAGQDSAVIGQQLATITGYQDGTITTEGDEPAQRLAYTAGPLHTVVTAAGDLAQERAVTRDTYDQGRPNSIAGSTVPPAADVVTSTTTGGVVYGADPATAILDDPRTATSTYDWALGQSLAETVDPSPAAGDEITITTGYDTEGRAIIATMPGGTAAGTTLTTYYDTATAAPCTGHPEWGGMVCTTAAQGPIASGANPQLVSTTATYTRTGAPDVVVESANGINRTTTVTYDAAERPAIVAVTATTTTGAATTALGAAVATRTLTYDPATGDPTSVSATIAGATQTIATTTDALGRGVSVTDGTGLAGATQYDALDRATSLTQIDTANTLPGGARRSFATTGSYDPTTGRLTSSTDSQAGTTSLGYDIDGEITSQAVTTGGGILTMTQGGDPTGTPTTRQWKLAGATDPVTSEQVTANIHGQWIDHSTTAGTVRRYSYDRASRLTAVTSLDSNATCTARSYSYNTNSDRLGEAATAPVPAGATSATNPSGCATPGSPAATHTFNSADRLTDPGYTYDTFGRTTRLALGGATATALTGQVMRVDYNVNDLVATQQVYANATDADANSGAGQNPTATQSYTLDVSGGRLQTFTSTGPDPDTGLLVTTTKTNRYASGSDSPEWIDEGTTGAAAYTLTRNIAGPAGDLLATTSNPAAGGAGTLNWQLTSLHGDIAVTLPDAIAEPLQAVPLADEFGVRDPTDTATRGADNRYGWLGGKQRSAEAPGGITLMGVRLYNPGTGRFLSTDPVVGGGANSYSYPSDPVNMYDLDGRMWGWAWNASMMGVSFVLGRACVLANAGYMLCRGFVGALVEAVKYVGYQMLVVHRAWSWSQVGVKAVIGFIKGLGGGAFSKSKYGRAVQSRVKPVTVYMKGALVTKLRSMGLATLAGLMAVLITIVGNALYQEPNRKR